MQWDTHINIILRKLGTKSKNMTEKEIIIHEKNGIPSIDSGQLIA